MLDELESLSGLLKEVEFPGIIMFRTTNNSYHIFGAREKFHFSGTWSNGEFRFTDHNSPIEISHERYHSAYDFKRAILNLYYNKIYYMPM